MGLIETIVALVLSFDAFATRIVDFYLDNTRTILDSIHISFELVFKVLLVLTVLLSVVFISAAIYSFFCRKVKKFSFDKNKAPTVTIQIPTRNELAALNCAKKCLAFDYPKEKFNIIIGDDSDKPEISNEIKAFAQEHKQVIYMKRKDNVGFKPGNLNNMLTKTDGEIIVIFDSDFLPNKDFLARLIAPFIHDPNLAASQARWNPINKQKSLTATLGTAITEVFHQIFLPVMYQVSNSVTLCGSAEAIRKSVIDKYGVWQSGSLTEDIEYSMRLIEHNLRVEFQHDLTCDMEVPYIPKDLYRQQMRWAYGVVSAIKEHLFGIIKARSAFGLKLNVGWLASGYALTTFIMSLFVTGMISFITHPPGPIDLLFFTKETVINIAWTSGLLITFMIGLAKAGRYSQLFKALLATFSVGLIVTFYVNKGVYKVFANQKMQWFLVGKQGNNR